MECWSLMIGARAVGLKGGRITRHDDELIQRITQKHFPQGFTILEAKGGWFDTAEKRFVREESRQILVSANGPSSVRNWGRELGRALQQKELVLVRLGQPLRLKITAARRKFSKKSQ